MSLMGTTVAVTKVFFLSNWTCSLIIVGSAGGSSAELPSGYRIVKRSFSKVRWKWNFNDIPFNEFLYFLEVMLIKIRDQRNGNPRTLGTGGTSDTMHIILGIAWNIVVHNKINSVYINSTGHNIGSDKNLSFAVFKP